MDCKTSRDCEGNRVCDKGKCRENKRDKPTEYYAEVCRKKNIPTLYEIGRKKGQPKDKEALKRCMKMASRAASKAAARPKAASAAARFSAPRKCKTSKDCGEREVCDAKKRACRESRRDKPIEYYIEKCKAKGIPVRYEVGPKKGQVKPVAALKRCIVQKDRSYKPAAARPASI